MTSPFDLTSLDICLPVVGFSAIANSFFSLLLVSGPSGDGLDLVARSVVLRSLDENRSLALRRLLGGLRGEGWLVVGKEEAKEDLSMPLLSLSLLVAIASEMLDLALLLALKSLEIPYFLSFLSSKPFLLTTDRLVSF